MMWYVGYWEGEYNWAMMGGEVRYEFYMRGRDKRMSGNLLGSVAQYVGWFGDKIL